MVKLLLALFILTITTFARADDQSCPKRVASPEIVKYEGYDLAIGVLARDANGRMYLGRSLYAGGGHEQIVHNLKMAHPIVEILWMGEMNIQIMNGRPEIREANETSGHYVQLTKNPGDLKVSNSFENLPGYLRAPIFQGMHFGEGPMRLARELEGLDADLRHNIGNMWAVLSSAIYNIRTTAPSDIEKERRVRDILRNSEFKAKMRVLDWLLRRLVDEQVVRAQHVKPLSDILRLLNNPQTRFHQLHTMAMRIDPRDIIVDVSGLSRATNAPVDIYELFD